MYRRLVSAAAIVGILLLSMNWLANAFYWYVSIPPFDMYMHMLGGIFVVLIGSAFGLRHILGKRAKEVVIELLLFVFIVGLAWEYYEYLVQFYIKGVHLADISDSISDVICDMVGGILGTVFVLITKRRYNKG